MLEFWQRYLLYPHTHTQTRFESLGLYILKCQIIHFLSCTKIIVGVNLCLQVGTVWFVSIFIYIYTIAHKFLQRNDLILHILMSLNLFCGCFFDIIEYYFWENKRWQQTKYKPWFEEKKSLKIRISTKNIEMIECTNSEYDGTLKTTQLIDLDAVMASRAICLVHFKNTQKSPPISCHL